MPWLRKGPKNVAHYFGLRNLGSSCGLEHRTPTSSAAPAGAKRCGHCVKVAPSDSEIEAMEKKHDVLLGKYVSDDEIDAIEAALTQNTAVLDTIEYYGVTKHDIERVCDQARSPGRKRLKDPGES